MVTRRWRVIQIPDSEKAELVSLDQPRLRARLAGWVGAAEPHGDVQRVWANDAASTAALNLKQAPYLASGRSISLSALSPADLPDIERPKFVKPKFNMRGLTPKELAQAPPDAAIVIIEFTGGDFSHGHNFMFGRQVPQGVQPEVLLVPKPQVYAFRLTPGVWRLEGILGSTASLSLCLGSPAFEVGPGEVVFAGTFNMYGDNLGPDMSPGPAERLLTGAPDLKAKLRPARWRNGSTAPCSLNAEVYSYVYAYDAPVAER